MAEHPKSSELIRFQVFCWQVAAENRITVVTPKVMVVAMLKSGQNEVTKVFDAMGVDTPSLQEELEASLESSLPKRRPKKVDHASIVLSEGSKEVQQVAHEICDLMDDSFIGTHHVMMAMLKKDADISTVLVKYGVTLEKFKNAVKHVLSLEKKGKSQDNKIPVSNNGQQEPSEPGPTQPMAIKPQVSEKELLSKYCRNLTVLASQGKLDPVIGREKEINRLVTTLGRRKKNNAILVGEPGVGKTAIVEGLAQRIASSMVPHSIKKSQIFQLSMAAVISKTSYRGQFEDRMRAILDLFAANKDYILFIDEMHTLIGAGGSIGGLDAANIMKPALAGGDVRCIGATTEDEYRKYFKRDGALDRRFQRVFVDEPTKNESVEILIGIKGIIESHHGCTISDDVIKCAVELSSRYVTDRYLPDKAIDCLDEACSNAVSIRRKKEGEIVVITRSDVVDAISSQTDMPVDIIGVSDINRARSLGKYMKARIAGQDSAVDVVSKCLLGAYSGIRNPNKPIGCFVFGGPSGSGTSYAAEVMASGLFESDTSLIRINMADFSEKFGSTKLTGSPPGYIGYGDKNILTDKVSRKPYCLILLDGMDGACEDVRKMISGIMSKGILTDASGHDVNFRNSVIIITVTCGSSSMSSMGFGDESGFTGDVLEESRKALINECRKKLGDEFINKVDEFVVFNKLGHDDLKRVAGMQMDLLSKRLSDMGVELNYDDKVLEAIVSWSENSSEKIGIKSVDRFIRRDIESAVSIYLSESDVSISCVSIEIEKGRVSCVSCDNLARTEVEI